MRADLSTTGMLRSTKTALQFEAMCRRKFLEQFIGIPLTCDRTCQQKEFCLSALVQNVEEQRKIVFNHFDEAGSEPSRFKSAHRLGCTRREVDVSSRSVSVADTKINKRTFPSREPRMPRVAQEVFSASNAKLIRCHLLLGPLVFHKLLCRGIDPDCDYLCSRNVPEEWNWVCDQSRPMQAGEVRRGCSLLHLLNKIMEEGWTDSHDPALRKTCQS